MAYGLWDQVNWLTKTVKRLCCAVDNIKKEQAANAAKFNDTCYLEILSNGAFPYGTLDEYNTNTDWDEPFTALVIINNTQRLYGGKNVYVGSIFSNTNEIISIVDNCGVITGLADSAFINDTNLAVISLPSITNLPTYAFANCSELRVVSLPNVITIGSVAFENCSSIKSINFPLLTNADGGAFRYCSSLTSINLPLLETIGQGVFTGVSSFAEVLNLPELLSAPQFSFNDMSNCIGYNLPKVQTVGYAAFSSSCVYATTPISFNLRSCIDLGGTVGDDQVWDTLSGKTVALTVPSVLMTCNSGNPDGDILYLQTYNTVTITTV